MTPIAQAQILTATRYLLFFAGTWLASHNYIKQTDVNGLVSAILIIVPPIWAWIDNRMKGARVATHVAAAVQAGINLAVSGNAVSDDGKTISKNNGGTPPKLVTLVTAPEIVDKYAPPVGAIAKV